jgi:translation initiation factor IF-2
MANKPNRPIRPRGGASPRGKRRVVIDQGGQRGGGPPGRQGRGRQEVGPPKQPREVVAPTGPVTVQSGVTVRDYSQALGVPMPELIKILMNLGQMRTATQSLSDEEVELIAAELKREVTIKHVGEEDEEPEVFEDAESDLFLRPPVVTIMGHVDHGKTSLLDAIRETAVVETEAGGITQHIGAYQVEHNGRRITFIDTPGHEAFTAMRARGARVTDIAVLVVAANDSVMPQTRESISHARAADVPIVVAINKVDLPDANPEKVRADLAAEELQPEEWGGTTQVAEVSAKTRKGLDELLEKVLLVADVELEQLKANPNADASGPIIESRLDQGRGPVATMLVQRGTLRVGDAIVAGDAWARVRALNDFRGEKLQEATPGTPVEILGFDRPPPAGETARVVENERKARELAHGRGERLRREQLAQRSATGVSLESLFAQMQEGAVQDLNLILKGDVDGSVEAAVSELSKIKHPEVRVNVIHQGVGGITENDVNLAIPAGALIIGFNVRPSAEARALAERAGVEIRTYRVIYQLTQDIEQALVGMLKPIETEETLGEAEVRALFRASRLGTIAGCMVTSGVVRRGAQVRVVREGTVIYETTIASLRRVKDDVREVQEGFECGILLDNFNDVKEGDVLECYETRQVERTDLGEPAPTISAPAS